MQRFVYHFCIAGCLFYFFIFSQTHTNNTKKKKRWHCKFKEKIRHIILYMLFTSLHSTIYKKYTLIYYHTVLYSMYPCRNAYILWLFLCVLDFLNLYLCLFLSMHDKCIHKSHNLHSFDLFVFVCVCVCVFLISK